MRPGKAWIVTCLLLVAASVIASSPTDAPAAVGAGAEQREIDRSAVRDAAEYPPAGGCAAIAYSDVFKSQGLGYVSSEAFAAALRAVASGDSRYSPAEIPPDWRVSAATWGALRAPRHAREADPDYSTAPSSVTAGQDGEFCSPTLVYLASMEYRLQAGQPKLKPAFPVLVREATRDLAARADAKRQLAGPFAARAGAIAAKIREAERMGAGECAPGTLADAKAELDRARREAAGIRSSVQETESSFIEAERIADTLLAGQRLASSKGLRCYKE